MLRRSAQQSRVEAAEDPEDVAWPYRPPDLPERQTKLPPQICGLKNQNLGKMKLTTPEMADGLGHDGLGSGRNGQLEEEVVGLVDEARPPAVVDGGPGADAGEGVEKLANLRLGDPRRFDDRWAADD